jgi:hypothetical protein
MGKIHPSHSPLTSNVAKNCQDRLGEDTGRAFWRNLLNDKHGGSSVSPAAGQHLVLGSVLNNPFNFKKNVLQGSGSIPGGSDYCDGELIQTSVLLWGWLGISPSIKI